MVDDSTVNLELAMEELMSQSQAAKQVKELLSAKYLRQPMAYVHTYGCQGNVADSEKLKGFLSQMGFGFASCKEQADLVLYNTCAVRENAELKLFGKIGELKALKERNPDIVIALCGCMMQQKQITAKICKSYPFVDLMFGTFAAHRFPELLLQVLKSKKAVTENTDRDNFIMEGLPVERESQFMASVQIMYGCNNFCSYCIVPYVRGREVSRKPEHIIAEVCQLAESGYKEILLLGQNVNSYGKGLEEQVTFSQLLRKLNEIPGDFRIRFMTSHPKDCTRELIDTIAECEKICPQLHLPVQCGNDRVLQEMNRHYTRAQYLELIRYAQEKVPGIGITSDIIVGFPGETYEEFLDTVSLAKEVRYFGVYTFIYSKRDGTKASEIPDCISDKEKAVWLNELLEVQHTISEEINRSYEGKTLCVLAENPDAEGAGFLLGHSDEGLLVKFPAPADLVGTFCQVKILEGKRAVLIGQLTGNM